MYFGSVRFFRHLILTVLVLLIAVPLFFAIRYGIKYRETVSKLNEVQAVVSQYDKTAQDQDQLVKHLSDLLDTSFGKQIPTFQQQVDTSVSEKIDALHTQMSSDIDTQMAAVKKDLEKSLSDQLKEMDGKQSQVQQQLTSTMKNQTTAIEQYVNKELEAKAAQIIQQMNASLSNQPAAQDAGQSDGNGGNS